MPVALGDRSGFPSLEPRAYLSHCAIAPPSTVVEEAIRRVAQDYARRGVAAFMDWHERREGLRARLAGLVGGVADQVGFVANTSTGVSTVALCYDWHPGDAVVVFRGEFPTNVTPWQQAARLFDLELVELDAADFLEAPERGLERLEARLKQGGVRMVAVSLVQFQTGLRMPVGAMAELAHAHGARLFCDAIQGVGVVPLDAVGEGIDFLAAGSHKWMMGMEGSAMLWVAPGRMDELVPRTAAWLSHEEPVDFLFEPGKLRYDKPVRRQASFVEGGAYNAVGLAALDAATHCIERLGVATIWAHVDGYLAALDEGLRTRGFRSLRTQRADGRSGILSVQPPAELDLATLVDRLAYRKVHVTAPDGYLRIAPHWPNAREEVDLVLEAVDAIR